MQRPRKSERVVYLTSVSLTPNSAVSWGNVSATPCQIIVSNSLNAFAATRTCNHKLSVSLISHATSHTMFRKRTSHPPAAAERKELPLVLSHTHVLQSSVDDLRLA
jgi:hypothetical protein